jgi:DNA-binding Lrp family transcriptional regulator
MDRQKDCDLDELDIRIVKRLTKDGRRRFTDLAQELDVSRATIRNRYQRMQQEHSLKIACWLDPERVGFHAGAQVKLSVEPTHLDEVTTRIAAFPEVTWLGQAVGEFNLMGDIYCQDMQHLNQFVSRELHGMPQIRHMEFGLYSRIYKVTTLPSLELLECAPSDPDHIGGNDLLDHTEGLVGRSSFRDGPLLDELDIAIVRHLGVDGRRPFTEIAEALGVSHGTVRNRYKQMLETNALKVVCWLDPDQVGFHAVARIDLSIETQHLEKAAEAAALFPEICWLVQVMGEFNLMADVMCLDIECLDGLVSHGLSRVPGVRHMEVAAYSTIRKMSTMPNLELLDRAASSE